MLITFITIQLVSVLVSEKNGDYNFIFLWGGLCAVLVGSASNVVNDIFDLEIDKINRPDRVLPKQLISVSAAWKFYAILVFSSLLCGFLLLPKIPFIIIIFSNILLFFYSFSLKKTALAGNLVVSFFISLSFVYSGLLVGNFMSGIIPFVFAFFLILSREVVKDIEDIEGDKTQFAETVPIIWGINTAKWISIGSLLICFLSLIISFALEIYGTIFISTVTIFVIIPGLILCYKIWNGKVKHDFSVVSKWLKILILPSLAAILLDKIL